MNTDPVVYCTKCGLERNCMLHLRAEFPPDAAKNWMKKHHTACDGKIEYRAGIAVRGPIKGMSAAE